MANWLSNKLVALHLDSNTVEAFLCNQGGLASLFLSRLACHILNLAVKHCVTLIPVYISNHLSVESDVSLHIGWFWSDTCFLMWLRLHFIFEVIWRRICWYPHIAINVHTLHLGKSHTLGNLGVGCFQPSLDLLGELHVSSSCISPTSSVHILAEHITSHLRFLILLAPCWMEASWLPTVLNMLVDVPYWCPIIPDLMVAVSVGWVLKGLQLLHLTLWLLRDMCCADKGFSSCGRW